jgi:hypothetical protein
MENFKTLETAIIFSLAASTAMAERINVASNATVQQSVDRLTSAVEAAGAKIFTTVDFAQGATSVGETLRPTTVVIFGSPKIGAPTLQQGQPWRFISRFAFSFSKMRTGRHGPPMTNRQQLRPHMVWLRTIRQS